MATDPLTAPLISIIDDDHSVLAATGLLVSSFGFRASMFSSAADFLQSARLDETDCLISDVHMPGTGGLELQRVLRVRGWNIPLIFMTAFFDENVKATALAGGAVCFLMKPFESRALLGCVNAALNRC